MPRRPSDRRSNSQDFANSSVAVRLLAPLRFLGVALVLALALTGSAQASTPNVDFTVENRMSGTPLRIEASVASSRGLRADLQVDGQRIAQVSLKPGVNKLTFDDVLLDPGEHTIRLRSGTLIQERTVRLLPGWLSVLPPLIAIGLALITRDVLISLFLGLLSGAFILYDWSFFRAFTHSIDTFIVPAVADSDHASIIVFTVFLGGMVGVITKSGGTHGIVEYLRPYATSRRRGQVATWFMGLMVFFDDYANTLIVGPTMRPITDKLRISREKLAYIVDSTAAPVVCLFPISTWVGFEIGLIGEAFDSLGLDSDPYSVFVASIPYRFYPLFAILMVLTLALSRVDFGPMKAAERRARREGRVLGDNAQPMADYSSNEVEPPEGVSKRAINAVVPILAVVVVTILGIYVTGAEGVTRGADDSLVTWLRKVLASDTASSYKALLWGSAAGMILGIVLPLTQKLLKIREAMTAAVAGCRSMFMALMVLTLAWALSAVCGGLDTAEYLVGLTSDRVDVAYLPALTFLLSAAVAFATGSSWGTMGIVEPLVIPICHSLALQSGYDVGSEPYLTAMLASIASVLTGSVWGDHCSPISDTTILSSMATGCDHIAHVRTQLPYALIAGFLALTLGSLPTVAKTPVWLSLVLGAMLIVGGIYLLSKRQGSIDGDEDDEPPVAEVAAEEAA